ncbi:MAG: Glu-tRNA(Gln) amidotransferase subunit GatE [Candidatus Hodarchaeaceae archaeon]|nr:Glu-tRNA(Gln) amidotransferase subunit GatE [Candidatus Hodarchaeaceae archaeon]
MKEDMYKKLGLKVGLEIHQELDTHKLFCNCPSILRDDGPPIGVKRRLRPTQSELGEMDRAALAEAIKGKGFNYQVYPDTICLVELDEEPPHLVNEEALDIALEIALLLNAKPVDEAHVMRKTVIDGSNTCGFQRTILVATDGYVETEEGRARIPTICLEEDAARKMGEDAGFIDYRLDRLGIPLVEIATGPDFSDPYTPAKVALHIGQLLRATGKVRRGIGTIRQDINISIAGGARQEIKGVQELALISTVIEREVRRQIALLEIRDELKRRGAAEVEKGFIEVKEIFSNTNSRVIRDAIKAGSIVLAVRLPKFVGLVGKELQPGRRFGTELADQARAYGGVGGIFHTDELPAHGISAEEVSKLRSAIKASPQDAVVFVADIGERAEAALSAVVDRANQALLGVPEETRRALPDGNTEFMRPLPGAARMYVETDIPPIPITEDRLRRMKERLPELPEQKRSRFVRDYGLSEELARRISLSEHVELFERLVKKYRVEPTLVASTIEETLVSLRREGLAVERIQEAALDEIFQFISKGKLAKEAIPEILRQVAKGASVRVAVKELGLEVMTKAEVLKLVSGVVKSNPKLIEERGEKALKPLMGIAMARARGRADGKLVHELLKRELKRLGGAR